MALQGEMPAVAETALQRSKRRGNLQTKQQPQTCPQMVLLLHGSDGHRGSSAPHMHNSSVGTLTWRPYAAFTA